MVLNSGLSGVSEYAACSVGGFEAVVFTAFRRRGLELRARW